MRKLAVLLTCVSALSAADISGTWLGKMPLRRGDYRDMAFKLTQDGTHVGGKMYGDYRSSPITEGTVSGDLVTFIVIAQEQTGNQISDTRTRFTGRITGSEMELVRDREASTNAGNGGLVQIKDAPKETIRLKRLP